MSIGRSDSEVRESGEPATVTIREAAEMLGVHVNTVRRRVKNGEFRAEKCRTERGEEYRIPVDELERGRRVITEITPRTRGNGGGSPATRGLIEGRAGAGLDVTQLYSDLKEAVREAAALRTERDIVQRQYAEAREELEELRKRVDDAEARAMKLETERIELLSELEQVRIAYRHSRDGKRRWSR